MTDHDVRVLDPGELRAAYNLFAATIHRGPCDDAGWSRAEPSFSPGRAIGVRESGSLVATAASFPSRTVVPGGSVTASRPAAGRSGCAGRARAGAQTLREGAGCGCSAATRW
ncbi:MAG: GNAT family N-acetyltransferase [Pseudonocardia sp.]